MSAVLPLVELVLPLVELVLPLAELLLSLAELAEAAPLVELVETPDPSRTHVIAGERRDLVVTDRYEPACARILRTPCSASAEYSSSTSSAR